MQSSGERIGSEVRILDLPFPVLFLNTPLLMTDRVCGFHVLISKTKEMNQVPY